MKKLSIIATSLVLGLSSVAFAQPDEAAYRRPLPPAEHMPPAPGTGFHHPWHEWTTLASGSSLSFGGRQTIRVRSSEAFTKLKLEAAGRGSMMLDKIVITFGNGQRQVVNCDKRLSAREPLLIDLDGKSRKISKVVVYGKSRRGSFNLLAV